MKSEKQMPAGKFKAQCLALMDDVKETGEPIVITKHGKPVAKLVAIDRKADDIFGFLRGKLKVVGDIESPVFSPEEWDVIAAGKKS